VAPTPGERCFLAWSSLNAETFHLVVKTFAHAFPDSLNLLLLDNSGAPTAQHLTIPANVCRGFLPPDGPELNLMERVWREGKDALVWQQCTHVEAPQDVVGQLLQAYDAPTRQSLTGYTYLVGAIHALCS
jgi:hypothetical protein